MPLSIDISFSHCIQSFHPAWLTDILLFITYLTLPAVLVLLIIAYVGFFHHHYNMRTKIVVLLLCFGNALSPILKILFARSRPTSNFVHVFLRETDFSFPSGHAMGITLFCSILFVLFYKSRNKNRSWLIWLCALFIALVSYSRIYLGVHWLTDILGGCAFAGVWIALSYLIIKKVFPKPETKI